MRMPSALFLVPAAVLATALAATTPAAASCPWTNSVRWCSASFATHTEPALYDSVQSCGVIGGDCLLPQEVAVYDIPGGLVRARVAGGSCGGSSVTVTSHDDYWIVGPASANPIQCTAQLALAGGGGGCGSSGTATFTAYNLPVTASFRTGPVAPSKCGLQTPLPPALYRPISQLVGVPFDLSIAVSAYNGPVCYSDFAYLTAQLSFTGLPPGYSVVSCNGYGATGPTPASASSWGRLKGIYR